MTFHPFKGFLTGEEEPDQCYKARAKLEQLVFRNTPQEKLFSAIGWELTFPTLEVHFLRGIPSSFPPSETIG